MAPYLEPRGDGVLIHLRLLPRSSRDRIDGEHDGRLKVRLTAPPIEGAANRALIKFLAKTLGVPKSSVSIVRGLHGREKVVEIGNITLDEAQRRLEQAIRRR